MDKKGILRDLSASDLREELLNRLRDQIRRNEEENEALREQIRQLTPDQKAISGAPIRAGRSRTLARNEQPLREVIAHVLREAGEPLRVKEVLARVRAAGYQTKASNFAGIVNISLSTNQELFEKVDRGLYKLREAIPEVAVVM